MPAPAWTRGLLALPTSFTPDIPISMSVPTVGLTGGIASGKSTVAQLFHALGIPIVDADHIAREVVAPGTDGLRDIVATFGSDVLAEDGSLDRPALGEKVFADSEARAKLNTITHPRIAALSAERIRALQQSGAPYLLYEAALLVEGGLHRQLAALVVVAAEPETQLQRIMARDGLSRGRARERIDAQLPLARKLEVADYVIHNDGDLEQTRSRVEEVHRALSQRFGRPASR